MKNVKRIGNIGLLLLLAITPTRCVLAQRTAQGSFKPPASSAYVRKSDGAYVTDNKVFEFADVFRDDGNGYIRLLLLKTIHNEHIDGHEETTGRIRVQAWTLGKNGTRRERWQFQVVGNDGQALYQDRFFVVKQWGCCDAPDTNSYFSLLSGNQLYVVSIPNLPKTSENTGGCGPNSGLLSVSAGNGGSNLVRYVALASEKDALLLQYGSDNKVMQKVRVRTPPEQYEIPAVCLAANGEILKGTVLESFTFGVVLRYDNGSEIRVPVQNDALVVNVADIPQGYSLENVPQP